MTTITLLGEDNRPHTINVPDPQPSPGSGVAPPVVQAEAPLVSPAISVPPAVTNAPAPFESASAGFFASVAATASPPASFAPSSPSFAPSAPASFAASTPVAFEALTSAANLPAPMGVAPPPTIGEAVYLTAYTPSTVDIPYAYADTSETGFSSTYWTEVSSMYGADTSIYWGDGGALAAVLLPGGSDWYVG